MTITIRTAHADARLSGKQAGYAGQQNRPPYENAALRKAWELGYEVGKKQKRDSEMR